MYHQPSKGSRLIRKNFIQKWVEAIMDVLPRDVDAVLVVLHLIAIMAIYQTPLGGTFAPFFIRNTPIGEPRQRCLNSRSAGKYRNLSTR